MKKKSKDFLLKTVENPSKILIFLSVFSKKQFLESQLEKSNTLIKQLTTLTGDQKERLDRLDSELRAIRESGKENLTLKKTVSELRAAVQEAEVRETLVFTTLCKSRAKSYSFL